MIRTGFNPVSALLLATTLLIPALRPPPAPADTVVLQNGRKKTGKVVHVGRDHVTLQVDEFLQLKLYRSQIREIITNRPPSIGADPNAVPFQSTAPAPTPEAPPDSGGYQVPPPLLIQNPTFRPQRTDGGRSDGKTLGVDGRPLAHHHIYARDSEYVANKFRDGMIRATPVDARDRLAQIRFLAGEIASVQRMQQDLRTGILAEGRERTRSLMLDSHERFQRRATEYRERYGHDLLKAPEYPFAQQIADLDSHVRTYQLCRNLIRFEEGLGVRDRIGLDEGETDRARALRGRLRQAVQDMARTREGLFEDYAQFFYLGRLPEETEPTSPKTWQVIADNTLLFPYLEIEGTAAFNGLLEDAAGTPVSIARPLILAQGQPLERIRRRTVQYPASGDQAAGQLAVIEVRIPKSAAVVVDYHSGKPIPETELRGWILADRIALR